MIDKFISCMKEQGWTVERNEKQRFCLPEPMKSRYTGYPESWVEFVSIVKSMIRGGWGTKKSSIIFRLFCPEYWHRSNKEVTDIFVKYLKKCCEKFCEKEKNGTYEKEELAKLRGIWNNLKKIEDVEDYIIEIRRFIEKL